MPVLPSDVLAALLSRPAWIFDMDGTLTERAHDFEGFKRAQGLPLDQPILEALDGMPEADVARVHAALQVWEEGLADRARPARGAVELLTILAERGAVVGILTRNTHDNALRTLQAAGLGGWFHPSAVLGRDSAPPKPSPEGIDKLLAHWGTTADHAVMVGDYVFDVQAGRAAGTATVWLDHERDLARPEEADHVVHSLFDLVPA
ncbi:MAG: HAD family hydrolase [Alphaproteobacteria bacterium]|nr:HAD family hydrolase [Alphaproteobacteria bacterium]